MKQDIYGKIKNILTVGINDECQLVFLLTKIRKILEDNGELKREFLYLNLYCNWALHVKIGDPNLVKKFITSFDEKDFEDQIAFDLKEHFFTELDEFCKKIIGKGISFTQVEKEKVREILSELYRDTPLIGKNGTYVVRYHDVNKRHYIHIVPNK